MLQFKNFYSYNEDLMFHLEKRLDFEQLFEWLPETERENLDVSTAEEYLALWKDVLQALGQVCAEQLAPNAKQLDLEHFTLQGDEVIPPATLVKNKAVLIAMGASALGIETAYGGMGAPFSVEIMLAEMMNRACPSTTLGCVWWGPIAHVLEQFASADLKDEYLPKIVSGEMSGNMALTEPDCGSDLSAIRTYAKALTDGSYELFGNKRFISNGDSEISLVLAKNSKGDESLSDLSLFLAPRQFQGKMNIQVAKIESKVGLHGSATCDLVYDGSKAFLIGEKGSGFKYMLSLMNDSRIGVGTQVVGLMQATFELANNYAQQRVAWGRPIAQHELIAEKLLDMEVELKATRSMVYRASNYRSVIDAGKVHLKQKLSPTQKLKVAAEVKRRTDKVRSWTPLIKYWAGERCYVHARNAVQILGGYGFSTEYSAEWWVRESLIYSLYEGTSQMQALMCTKDTIKAVIKNPTDFIELGVSLRIKTLGSATSLRRKLYKLQLIEHSVVLAILFKVLKINIKSSFSISNKTNVIKMIKLLGKNLAEFKYLSPALLNAERLTEVKCLTALSESLILDAEVDSTREWIAERFLNTSLPKANYLRAQIEMDGPIIEERLAPTGEPQSVSLGS